jgi:hypothetical protein
MGTVLSAIGVVMLVLADICQPIANTTQGEPQVAQFHDRYSRGDYEAIYDATEPQLREVMTADQFLGLMRNVNEHLGAVQSTERSGVTVRSSRGEIVTIVIMESIYERGTAQETFTFLGCGEDMKLLSWFIQPDTPPLRSADPVLPLVVRPLDP